MTDLFGEVPEFAIPGMPPAVRDLSPSLVLDAEGRPAGHVCWSNMDRWVAFNNAGFVVAADVEQRHNAVRALLAAKQGAITP